MINLFDFIAVDEDNKILSQTDIKKKVNKLRLKEIQDLTSQIDQEIIRLYKKSMMPFETKSKAVEFLQSLRKIELEKERFENWLNDLQNNPRWIKCPNCNKINGEFRR